MIAPSWLFTAWICAGSPQPADDTPQRERPTRADVAAARQDVATGDRHYEAGHFAEAAAYFAAAYERAPEPDTLYRWAQAERRAGNCPIAAQLYRRYLTFDVGADNEEAARKNLARCGHADDEPPPPEPAPQTLEDMPPPSEPQSWARDPMAVALVAVGGSAMIAGAVLAGVAAAEHRAARDADVEDDYRRHADRVGPRRTAAIATGAIGAALVVGGVVRWIVVARRGRRGDAAAAMHPLVLRF